MNLCNISMSDTFSLCSFTLVQINGIDSTDCPVDSDFDSEAEVDADAGVDFPGSLQPLILTTPLHVGKAVVLVAAHYNYYYHSLQAPS
jgi:hypothetical protein